MVRYYKELPEQDSSLTAVFASIEEDLPSNETASMYDLIGGRENISGTNTYYCAIPENVLSKEPGYQWYITLENEDGQVVGTDIFTVPENSNLCYEKLKDLENRIKIMEIKNQLLRDMIDGRTETVDDDTILVYNKDDVIIQKLSVVDGVRTPQFKTVVIDYVDGEPELAITATLAQDDEGNDYWIKELTQEGDI
jgi:hypothetical protein